MSGTPNLASFYLRSLSLLKWESRRLDQTGWLEANWVHLSNWIVFAGREDKIVIALRKARAPDGLEIMYFNMHITCTVGHGSFQSKKEWKSKLHQLLPEDCIIRHNTATQQRQQHKICSSQMWGLYPWSHRSCHKPDDTWAHTPATQSAATSLA